MHSIHPFKHLLPLLQKKKVLFVTTKNLSYIRNTQEINLIKENADSYTIIGSSHKSYMIRLIKVYSKLLLISPDQYDIIFLGFAPQLVLPLFWHRFKKSNASIIVDFFISLFDTLCCDRKKINPNSLPGKLLHWLDKTTLSLADAVICDTNAHGKYFIDEFDATPAKIFTLYLHADASIYHVIDLPRPKHLNGKYAILYFGSILPLQGVDIVLKAINLLKDQEELYFYFIGPIKDRKLLASKPISSNIEYIDWLCQEDLAKYINYADLCLAGHFHPSIAKARRTIPGKAYIYQAIKKPMILGDNPANHELFVDGSDVTFVEMGNPQALAEAIFHLSKTKSPSLFKD